MTIHLDLASPPKKVTKEPKHERQHPTSKKHPSEGFGIAPQKRQKKNTNTKGSTRRARNTQARDLASPPKKGNKRTQARKAAPDEQETPKRGIWHRPPKNATKENKHERQHPTSKKHPSEGFGIRPQKRQGSTWLDSGNLDRIWTFWDYKMVFHSK